MAGQVHGRFQPRETASASHLIFPWPSASITSIARSCRASDARAGRDLDAERGEPPLRLAPRIDHGGNLETGRTRIGRGAPAVSLLVHREATAGRGRITVDSCVSRPPAYAGAVIVADAIARARPPRLARFATIFQERWRG
jgi:hypothetical protein